MDKPFHEIATMEPPSDDATNNRALSRAERLEQLRAQYVASGEPLLSLEEIEQEVAARRGGLDGSSK